MGMLNEAYAVANATERDLERIIRSDKYKPLTEREKFIMGKLLSNVRKDVSKSLNENTMTADVEKFTPILMPMVRRVFPNLIANELLGIQPLDTPTGYIYSLVNSYLGDGVNKVGNGTNPTGVIYETKDPIEGLSVGDTVGDGKALYIEDNKVLASFATTKLAVGATIANTTVTGIYTNESAFGKILKNFTGPYTTSEGEVLGVDMREIGFSIARKSIEVKTRKLKGRYTLEMYDDAKSQHGILADEELMNLMSYEMQAEMDREVVDLVNGTATQLPNTNFGLPSTAADIIIPDGRWEIERYRTNVIRIDKESVQIGLDTKRGNGNILLVSPLVATMLEQVGTLTSAPVASDVMAPVSGGFAGIFNNRYRVIIDQYATTDYCTVLYKGEDSRDAMGFFAPYIPLQFINTQNYESGQPAILCSTRYAIGTIPGVENAESDDRARLYARSFGVDFTNTILAH